MKSFMTDIVVPGILPVLPLKGVVPFPHTELPMLVGRETSLRAIRSALETDKIVMLVSQKDHSVENPAPEDIHSVGSVGVILRTLPKDDRRIKALFYCLAKAEIVNFIQTEPFFVAAIKGREERTEGKGADFKTLVNALKERIAFLFTVILTIALALALSS